MSYRFLPWVRRGLAAEIVTADQHDGTMPARATFPVTLAVSGGGPDAVSNLQLYGPGDIVGLDTRSIVRVEPKARTGDHPPNQFATLELDEPDLPWMFTPARASGNDRLRPWLVLLVVAKQPGVSVAVTNEAPLPVLTISAPAVPSAELPDLADSWAWAHAQLIDDGSSVPAQLADEPDRNVARLVAPRRLDQNTDYIAALVPAFESGRAAGLGLPVDTAATTGPAWPTPAPAEVRLPLYYHWEFRTGPSGDFESLARRLRPIELPDGVGSRPMFIGAADPALPSLAPSAGGVIEMEGALRSPDVGTGGALGPEHAGLVAALTTMLDAGHENLANGTTSSIRAAENVAPPIYGSWHARTHRIPTGNRAPRWLRDLNTDPQHRVAAGLGTAVVQANQERYMDAAWGQVGDIIAANAALELARLIQLVAKRLLDRHLRPLPHDALLGLTAPSHIRTLLDGRTIDRLIHHSTLPDRATDAAFRRRVTPRSPMLNRASRLGPGSTLPDGGVELTAVTKLAGAELGADLDRRVDGLTSSVLLDGGRLGGGLTVEPVNLRPALQGELGRELTSAAAVLEPVDGAGGIVSVPAKVRPDLQLTGVLLDDHIAEIDGVATGSLHSTLGQLLELRAAHRDLVAFGLDERGTPLAIRNVGDRLLGETLGGGAIELGRVDPGLVRRLDRGTLGRVLGRLPAGALDERVVTPEIRVRIPGRRQPIGTPIVPIGGGTRPPITDPPVTPPVRTTLVPPVLTTPVVAELAMELTRFLDAAKVTAVSTVPQPTSLDLAHVGATMLAAVDPHDVIETRVRHRITIAGAANLGAVTLASDRFRQAAPTAPIMIGPQLPVPLYAALAAYDQERFLPGAAQLPANAITLMETNPRFVEAFLVGANHEMNRELLWRKFPTDRMGTPFHHFWDRIDGSEDIGPIHLFNGARGLGGNSVGQIEGSLVLLVRGDLLRRYPNSIVYAAPSLPDRTLDPDPARITFPVFDGQLTPDITFVGFDLTVEDVLPDPGWFFVIQEQPSEPRFGLDEPGGGGGGGTPSTWSDLTWAHPGTAPGGWLSLSSVASVSRTLASGGSVQATWGDNAAHMAAITFQRTFRVAVHSDEVLEGTGRMP